MDLSLGFSATQIPWAIHWNMVHTFFAGNTSEEYNKNPAIIENPINASYLASDYYKHIPVDYKHPMLIPLLFGIPDSELYLLSKDTDIDFSNCSYTIKGPFIPYNSFGIPKAIVFRARASITPVHIYKDDYPERYNNVVPIFSNGDPDKTNDRLFDRSIEGYVYISSINFSNTDNS